MTASEGTKEGEGSFSLFFCPHGKPGLPAWKVPFTRVQSSNHPGGKFILRLRMCILSLRMCIFSLRMCISNLKIKKLAA